MPSPAHYPYIACKKLPSPIEGYSYRWQETTAEELDTAIEVSGLLIKHLLSWVNEAHKPALMRALETLEERVKNPLPLLRGARPWQVKLSFELLQGVDEVLKNGVGVFEATRFLGQFHSVFIAMNFREVFFVSDGESPPSHYRPEVDISVNTLKAFQEQTQTFSYLLAKNVLHTFLASYSPLVQPYTIKDMPAYQDHKSYYTVRGLLHRHPIFNSAQEAALVIGQRGCFVNKTIIVAFGPKVSIPELEHFLSLGHKEVVILLFGSDYRNEETRERVYRDFLQLIDNMGCGSFLHVFLLTLETAHYTLENLVPNTRNTLGAFTPLAHNAGYYLSDPQIFASSYRYRQLCFLPRWMKRAPIEQNTSTEHKSSISDYIYGTEERDDFRKSKRFTRETLKAKVALSLNHQQTFTQNQEIVESKEISQEQALNQNQTQTLSQTVQQTKSHNQHDYFSFITTYYFDDFCKRLMYVAQRKLEGLDQRAWELERIYLTQYGLQRHDTMVYLSKLASTDAFRVEVAATFFGMAVVEHQGKQRLVSLPNYSIDSIDAPLVHPLLEDYMDEVRDGPDPEKDSIALHYAPFGGRMWTRLERTKCSVRNTRDAISVSSLTHINDRYQSHLQSFVLVREEEMARLPAYKKRILLAHVSVLLNLFKANLTYSQESVLEQEAAFFALIRFHFPKNPEYLTVLERFFGIFEAHNADNVRILTQIMVSGYRPLMESFFTFLTVLDSRSLLPCFYKIYFKYAKDIFSVVEMFKATQGTVTSHFKYTYGDPFPYLVYKFGKVTSIQNWPLFEKLSYAILVYAAKNNPHLHPIFLSELYDFWCTISVQFLGYTNQQQQEAEALLERFIRHILAFEELNMLPVENVYALLAGLLKLIENAIAQHTLEEQLTEIGGLSLLRTDALYAIGYNDFQVVCAEMELQKAAIDPKTKRYSVSLEELQLALANHTPAEGSLKKTVFRYLGTVRLREDLHFYRELFAWSKSCLSELVIGYYVAATTGMAVDQRPSEKQFTSDFLAFLYTHPWASKIAKDAVTHIVSEFFMALRHKEIDATQGSTSLWSFCEENSISILPPYQPIPPIFTKKFKRTDLKRFLLTNKKALQEYVPLLEEDAALALAICRSWLPDASKAQFSNTSLVFLNTIYPQLTMAILLENLPKIITFLESHALLVQRGARGKMYVALKKIIEKKSNIDLAIAVIHLVSAEMIENTGDKKREQRCINFIGALAGKEAFLTTITDIKPLLASALSFYMRFRNDDASLSLLFTLCETLIPRGTAEASPLLERLLTQMYRPEMYAFFKAHPRLTALQLEAIAELLESQKDNAQIIPLLELCLLENPQTDLKQLRDYLKTSNSDVLRSRLILGSALGLEHLARLKMLEESTLEQLLHLYELYKLPKEELVRFLESPSIPEAIAAFEHTKYANNTARYIYDSGQIAQKIAKIRYKALDGKLLPLSPNTQEKLHRDYEKLMSYMTKQPIFIDQGKAFSIHNLSRTQCQRLFKALIAEINKGNRTHEHQLVVLALCCELMYRTTNKFPRDTQILTVLNDLQHNRNILHEVRTGEGKSIIAAMRAVLAYDGKTNIDIVTENNQLAKDGLNTFKHLFRYLGIPYGKAIIESHSAHRSYVEHGIHYSTPNIALFYARMILLKKKLPTKLVLICDEIDAILTTLLQFRLSATIDPLLLDTKWPAVYKSLLDFVQEKRLFTDNTCSEKADVFNFKRFFMLHNSSKDAVDFVNKINEDTLHSLIESVQIANALEENHDYFIVEKKRETTSYYAAPILDITNRPDPRISYSDAVQQILHTRLNQEQPGYKYDFDIEPGSETILVISAKNFFDFYRDRGGLIIGFTGTSGIDLELQEFWENYHLVAFSYPSFYENNHCDDLGLISARGPRQHLECIGNTIDTYKKHTPTGPILIITSSPEDTVSLNNYLSEKSPWKLQMYHGYEQEGQLETELLALAGEANTTTIANESLARGADIKPLHARGLLVINTNHQITESRLRQIYGRAGRGKPGQFCSVIDVSSIVPENSTDDEIAAAFQAQQRHLSVVQQKQRLSMRLLEKARYRIVNDYLLALRTYADKILSRQYGYNSELIPYTDLMTSLSTFNSNAERHYNELLNKHMRVEGAFADEFLEARVSEYQQILERWLPNTRFINFCPIEPLIPLENLENLTALSPMKLEQLTLFSELLAKGWELLGHQAMQVYLRKIDKQIDYLSPYFNKQCSLQYALCESIQREQLVDVEKIRHIIEEVQEEMKEFIRLTTTIPLVGALVPAESLNHFFTDYLDRTGTQIKEKKWDELALPKIDVTALTVWFSRVNTAMTLGAVVFGGPIPFIINRLIVPTLTNWLTAFVVKRFANSSSVYLQAIAGLSNIGSELSICINSLIESSRTQSLTVGTFLEKLAPLLTNKCLHQALIALLKLNKQTHWIPLITAMPELLTLLEPYREQKFSSLLTVETLVSCFVKASQLKCVKPFLEDTDFEPLLARCCMLSPARLTPLYRLNFKELFGLAKVIAHPEFCTFLKNLPPQTTFSEMLTWIGASLELVPIEMRGALQQLKTYQSERERIEEDSRRGLLFLKEQFSLSTEQLKAALKEKPAVLPDMHDAEVPVISSPPIPWVYYGVVATGLSLLVLYNILFFTLTVLLISLIVISLLVFPVIKDTVILQFSAKNNPIPKSEPLLLYANRGYEQQGFFGEAASHNTESSKQELLLSVPEEKEFTLRLSRQEAFV